MGAYVALEAANDSGTMIAGAPVLPLCLAHQCLTVSGRSALVLGQQSQMDPGCTE